MKEKYQDAKFYWKNSIFPSNFDLEVDFVPVRNSHLDEAKKVDTKGLYVLRIKVKMQN